MSRMLSPIVAALLVAVQASASAQIVPTAGQVALTPTPQLAKEFDAFPRLAGGGPIVDRINAGLAAADARGLKAARACLADAPQGSWSRSVEVTMRGPEFVSFVAHDESSCGGPYPNASMIPLVYDLATGRPVDWTRLFPKSVTGTVTTTEGGDGTVLGVMYSRTLLSRYLFGLKMDDACGEAFDAADLHFMLWPDPKAGGLVLYQEDLPHAVRACGGPVTVPLGMLSGFGTSPRLINAITAATRAAP